MAGRRRNSFVQIATNPLEQGGSAPAASAPKVESLADAMPILADEFGGILETLKSLPDNDARLSHLEEVKKTYLFSSEQLLKLLAVTPSIKTKIAMVGHVGPRLMDPKAKHNELLDIFTYAEQKKEVEDILKARAQSMMASSSTIQGAGGGGVMMMGGRGGRGRGGMPLGGGRGRGGPARGAASAPPAEPKPTPEPEPEPAPSIEPPLPTPPPAAPAAALPPTQPTPKRRPSATQIAMEEAGFEPKVIDPNASIAKASGDRASPATATVQRESPNLVQDSGEFDKELKQKSEERQRVTAVRRSSKIDDWMSSMKNKGSGEDVGAKPPATPAAEQDADKEEDDVFDDPIPIPVKRTNKRLSTIPLTLDRSEMNGFPSFEEQKSFEMIAQRRPSISKTRTKEIISYDELLAIVESKQYGSLVKTELEEYLSDEEFKHCFQIERDLFRGLPGWRKQAMKKTLGLF